MAGFIAIVGPQGHHDEGHIGLWPQSKKRPRLEDLPTDPLVHEVKVEVPCKECGPALSRVPTDKALRDGVTEDEQLPTPGKRLDPRTISHNRAQRTAAQAGKPDTYVVRSAQAW